MTSKQYYCNLIKWLCAVLLLMSCCCDHVRSFQVSTPSLVKRTATRTTKSIHHANFHLGCSNVRLQPPSSSSLYMSSTTPKLNEFVVESNNNNNSLEEEQVTVTVQSTDDDDNNKNMSSSSELLSNNTKFWNAMLLAAAFGYALYSLVNIDHGMMRGWTQSEIAMRIPLDNWASYEASLNNKPVWTKTCINVIIYLLGDWLSQTIFAKKPILEFDAARTLRNGFIGLCFGPLVHLYYEFSDSILPVEVGINRLYKIGMDQTIYLAVKCSIYIMAVNLLAGENFGTAKDTVKTKLPNIMFTAWKFWPLVHCVTYGVIPARHRILWVNSVDLIWNAILATQTSKKDDADDDIDADADGTITVTATVTVEDQTLHQQPQQEHDTDDAAIADPLRMEDLLIQQVLLLEEQEKQDQDSSLLLESTSIDDDDDDAIEPIIMDALSSKAGLDRMDLVVMAESPSESKYIDLKNSTSVLCTSN